MDLSSSQPPDRNLESVDRAISSEQNNALRHFLLDLYGCSAKSLNDEALVRQALDEAARCAGTTVLKLETHAFQPQGITAFALLAESHLSFHSWPEKGFAAVDLFTCSANGEPQTACDLLANLFAAEHWEIKAITRGQ